MRRAPRKNQRGLTIIEIALATAILAMMATITWGSIARSFDAYEAVSEIDGRYHNVRVAMNRMSRELSMAFLTAPTRNFGREEMWKTIFKAKRASSFYEVHFTSLAHQVLRQDAKESDQCELSYFSAPDPDQRDVTNLMRREDPRIDSEPEEGGRAYVLAENVKGLALRFWDPRDQDWVDEWDTEDTEFAGRLPSIIEITLTILDDSKDEMKFVTKTRVYMPAALSRF
jgi:general secretion pathway protein J